MNKNVKNLDIDERLDYLKKLRSVILTSKDAIVAAVYNDFKKPVFEAKFLEYYPLIHEIDYFIKNLKKLSKRIKVAKPWFLFNTSNYLYPEPYGEVLVISPWNFPLQLTFLPLIGAIAAGNRVTVKPSELSSCSEKLIINIIKSALPEDVVRVVVGDAIVVTELLKQKFDLIFFTGSPENGRHVMKAAAEHLTPVVLELGGKSPAIIEDGDIDVIAADICRGKFSCAGQACIAVDYILVQKKIKDQLVKSIIQHIEQYFGADASLSPSFARIINEHHCSRLVGYLKDVNIIYGGKYNLTDCYVSPTIVDQIPEQHPLLDDEIFGPILPIITYANIEDAISFINMRAKPLAAYFFSNDKVKRSMLLKEIPAGGISIDSTGMHFLNFNLPFGGVGNSGIGAYHRKASFDVFTHYKPVSEDFLKVRTNLLYPPYFTKEWLFRMLK